MKVVGLDPSLTSTGWARMDGPSREVGRILTGSLRGVARLQAILNKVIRICAGADLVLLEGYAYGRANQAHQLGELGGVIRLGLHQKQIPWIEVPPKCVKKLATGAGNAKKEAVLAEAVRRLDYRGASTDEADALWLLQFALIHYALPGAAELPKSHLAYMDEVDWPDLAVGAVH